MSSVTAWTVDAGKTQRIACASVLRGALTMGARRPGLLALAGLPEFLYVFVDSRWLERLPDDYLWLSLLTLPVGTVTFAWTYALFAAAWDATDRSPTAIVVGRLGVLFRTYFLSIVVLLVGLPLVFPALYYGVHYFYAGIIAVREDTRRPLAILRRSKMLARRHRLATWTLSITSLVWNVGLTLALDALSLGWTAQALLESVLLTAGNVALAAIAAQAYARWKAVDTLRSQNLQGAPLACFPPGNAQ